MLWARNLLFVALVGGGTLALGAKLMPPRESRYPTTHHSPEVADPDFQLSVLKINAAFKRQWEAAGVVPVEPASDLAVARRLSLGLMGTTPSLEEIRRLEHLPPADQLDGYLDRVLADRRSADYLAERLARASVGTEDGPFIFYRRRRYVAWLADQVAANRPYDDLVREMIAGTGLWTDHPAANFVSVTAQPEMENQPNPVRLAGRVTRAFLGIRLDCAQCHDHPFTSWKQGDFEGLAAFFGQTHIGFKGIADGDGEYQVEDRKTQTKRAVAPKVAFQPELVPAEGTRRQQLAAWVTHRQNPAFARAAANRMWAIMTGRPLVDPVDSVPMDDVPPALQALADDFAAHNYDLRRLVRVIAHTRAYRLDSASEKQVGPTEEEAWAVFPLTRLRPEQVAGGVLQATNVLTLDGDRHVFMRLMGYGQHNNFVTRYGDSGDDEFGSGGGTIPQRLLMMNGEVVRERIKPDPQNASARIGSMAPSDAAAIEAAYLSVLSRRPTPAEIAHFAVILADDKLPRGQRMEDLYWALLNSTEFAWNH